MSRSTKIALGIIGGLVVLCVLVVVGVIVAISVMGPSIAENMIVDDPAKVAESAGEIAEYDLPPGYEEKMVMNIFVGKIVAIGHEDQSSGLYQPVIMIMQISSLATGSEANRQSFQQQMQQSMESQASQGQLSLELVDEKEVEISGQDVNLLIYEGEDEDGNQIRQVISDLFEVKDAQVMLMIMGQADNWPEEDIDAFIESIH
jgi:hypothetical protein